MASVGIDDEDGTVFAADLDRLAGVGALVEEVETRLRIVVGIHSRIACHGGSMGSKVSMSKGGSGGGGTMGGFAAGCFSPAGSVSAAVGRGSRGWPRRGRA